MPLPRIDDAELVRQLTVVVSAGWSLPSRPGRAHDIRHLLLLADRATASSYKEATQRLLVMMDHALKAAVERDRLSEDVSTGVRILLGTHPTYRNEASPTVRRREAADYLVPSWHDAQPADPAGTFQRRHQERFLRMALEALRAEYGQESAPSTRDHDYLIARRHYHIDVRRQLYQMDCEAVIRARHDGYVAYQFDEPRHLDPGALSSSIEVLTHATGPTATLAEEEDIPWQRQHKQVTFVLSEAQPAGAEIGVAWRQTYHFGEEVEEWESYFVSLQAVNDNYLLELSVTFEGAPPSIVWHFEVNPEVDILALPPGVERRIHLDKAGHGTYTWPATEKRIEYGIRWQWDNPDYGETS